MFRPYDQKQAFLLPPSLSDFLDESRHVRRRLGLSTMRFSKMAGIAHNSLGKLERNKAVLSKVRTKLVRFLKTHYPEALDKGG